MRQSKKAVQENGNFEVMHLSRWHRIVPKIHTPAGIVACKERWELHQSKATGDAALR